MEQINLLTYEDNPLFIIGNGFDKAHGIKSSYWDFREWLFSNGYSDVVNNWERIFNIPGQNESLLWKDFENAIGIYNAEQIHNLYFQGVNDFTDKEVSERVVKRIKLFVESISDRMREWARNMNGIDTCTKVFDGLEPQFKYLSFNYTLVLEQLYHIPDNSICHIHGNRNDDRIIVGHNQWKNPQEELRESHLNVDYSRKNIVELMNTNVKPVEEQIKRHKYFFNSLYNINIVIVIGHSLSQVDMPYFREITKYINKSVWHFFYHSDDEYVLFNSLIHQDPFNNPNYYKILHKI